MSTERGCGCRGNGDGSTLGEQQQRYLAQQQALMDSVRMSRPIGSGLDREMGSILDDKCQEIARLKVALAIQERQRLPRVFVLAVLAWGFFIGFLTGQLVLS